MPAGAATLLLLPTSMDRKRQPAAHASVGDEGALFNRPAWMSACRVCGRRLNPIGEVLLGRGADARCANSRVWLAAGRGLRGRRP
jgi:hypothetical protein